MNLIYSKVNSISGKKRPQQTPSLTVNGNHLIQPNEVANALALHFHRVSSESNYSAPFLATKEVAEREVLDFSTAEHFAYNDKFSLIELENNEKKCRNTAPGPDGVHYQMLKNLHPRMKGHLLSIYNKCWTEGSFPLRWSEAIILAFPKPNKPPDQPSSYRPIALASCICKLLEKMVNARLQYALETMQAISRHQFGFRRMRGTEDSLACVESMILGAFQRKKHIVGIFFDIAKAYDTTWRFGILKKLHNIGIRGNLARFIQNFLPDRSFRVRINSMLSDSQTQEQGVPQGSVLSCLLFLIAINDIASTIPPMVKPSLYVDDLAIYMEVTFIDSAQRVLQRAVDAISSWADANGFRLSTEKTSGVVFHRKRQVANPHITLYSVPIKFEDKVKFLGLTFDKNLRWEAHISDLRGRVMKASNILKVLSHLRWGADRLTLLCIYRYLIRSKMDYGSQIYATANESAIYKLSVLHHICIRLCTGAFKSSPIQSLYAESGEPSLKFRRDTITLQHYARIQRLPRSIHYQNVCGDMSSMEIYADNEHLTQPLGCRVIALLEEYQIGVMDVKPCSPSTEAVWRIAPLVCKELRNVKKSEHENTALKRMFLDHLSRHHPAAVAIYTDGSKTSDSSGFAVVKSGEVVISKRMSGTASIYTCELSAIYEALISIPPETHSAVIVTDSLSALQGVEDLQTSNALICDIQREILKLQGSQTGISLCWVPSHVGVPGNEMADKAAQDATTGRRFGSSQLPFSDFYPLIKKKIRTKWQEQWRNTTNNKLREIKTSVGPWESSSLPVRTHEVSLCRLRIGHTLYTQQYLMERREQPLCAVCGVPLTVKHFLTECREYRTVRYRIYGRHDLTMSQILADTEAFNLPKLLEYLRSIDLYNKI